MVFDPESGLSSNFDVSAPALASRSDVCDTAELSLPGSSAFAASTVQALKAIKPHDMPADATAEIKRPFMAAPLNVMPTKASVSPDGKEVNVVSVFARHGVKLVRVDALSAGMADTDIGIVVERHAVTAKGVTKAHA